MWKVIGQLPILTPLDKTFSNMNASKSLPFGGCISQLQTMYFLFIDPIRPHQYVAVMPDSKTKLPWQRTGRLVDLQGKVRSTICNSFQSTINS